jgi:hypothetical protein
MKLLTKQKEIIKSEIEALHRQLAFMDKKSDHYKALSMHDTQRAKAIEIEIIELSKSLNKGSKGYGDQKE